MGHSEGLYKVSNPEIKKTLPSAPSEGPEIALKAGRGAQPRREKASARLSFGLGPVVDGEDAHLAIQY
jgi:hypothetical protein